MKTKTSIKTTIQADFHGKSQQQKRKWNNCSSKRFISLCILDLPGRLWMCLQSFHENWNANKKVHAKLQQNLKIIIPKYYSILTFEKMLDGLPLLNGTVFSTRTVLKLDVLGNFLREFVFLFVCYKVILQDNAC